MEITCTFQHSGVSKSWVWVRGLVLDYPLLEKLHSGQWTWGCCSKENFENDNNVLGPITGIFLLAVSLRIRWTTSAVTSPARDNPDPKKPPLWSFKIQQDLSKLLIPTSDRLQGWPQLCWKRKVPVPKTGLTFHRHLSQVENPKHLCSSTLEPHALEELL